MAGGIAKPLLELDDEDELLLEELDELDDELLELLDDELLEELEDELLELLDEELLELPDEVPSESCPPHAPIRAARVAAPRILRNFIMSTLLAFYLL